MPSAAVNLQRHLSNEAQSDWIPFILTLFCAALMRVNQYLRISSFSDGLHYQNKHQGPMPPSIYLLNMAIY
jgi:hypothetical protein